MSVEIAEEFILRLKDEKGLRKTLAAILTLPEVKQEAFFLFFASREGYEFSFDDLRNASENCEEVEIKNKKFFYKAG